MVATNDPGTRPTWPERALGVLFIVMGLSLGALDAFALFLSALAGSSRYNLRAGDLATALMTLAAIDAGLLLVLGFKCALRPSVSRRSRYGFAAVLLLVAGASVALYGVRIHGPMRWSRRAIGAIHEIATAELIYRERGKESFVYGTLEQLVDAGLIKEDLRAGRTPGYRYTVKLSTKTPEFEWCVVATPDDPERFEFFFRNAHGGLRVGSKPPVINPETCEADDSFRLPAGSGLK